VHFSTQKSLVVVKEEHKDMFSGLEKSLKRSRLPLRASILTAIHPGINAENHRISEETSLVEPRSDFCVTKR